MTCPAWLFGRRKWMAAAPPEPEPDPDTGAVGEVLKDRAERDLQMCEDLVGRRFAGRDYVEGSRGCIEKRKPVVTGS